jgi:hypothetical protein
MNDARPMWPGIICVQVKQSPQKLCGRKNWFVQEFVDASE